jgi:protein-disulfide isomerase
VKLVFYDMPIPGHGLPAYMAHEAAHCAGEAGQYWAMHDALFDRQDELSKLDPSDEARIRTTLVAIGKAAGTDTARLDACLVSQRYRPILASLAKEAGARGVDSTPTFLLVAGDRQDVVLGYVPFEEMAAKIDQLLSPAPGTPATTPTAPAAATPSR